MLADNTLDGFITELPEAKLRLVAAVEGDVPPDASILDDLCGKLRSLGPALLLENKLAQATGEVRERLESLAEANTGLGSEAAKPLLDAGAREFRSGRDPSQVYLVTFGRGGHLECTCDGFKWRGVCKHAREVRIGVS
jgi:SWI/SNF-related matrix-associated actin-dependent regulator of chromatin subfamily A-like protein 1